MTFKKGQSGNPLGRRPVDGAIQKLARENSPEAVERLIEWMRSDNPKASVSACNAILDRAYGKPPQAVALDANLEAGAGLLAILAKMSEKK